MRLGFQMTFGVDPAAVARVVERFVAFAEEHALPAPVRRSIQVALDEFVYNPIVYGFLGAEGVAGEGPQILHCLLFDSSNHLVAILLFRFIC